MRKKRSFLLQLLNYCSILWSMCVVTVILICGFLCGYVVKSVLNNSWDFLQMIMYGSIILFCIFIGVLVILLLIDVIFTFIQKAKAIYRTTQLPLSNEEMHALGISSAGEYWEFIKEQISYREFNLKKEHACVHELYLEESLKLRLVEQLLAFEKQFTEEEIEKYEKDSIVFSSLYYDMERVRESQESD